ncbi:MAG: peptidylprolyl isomerase [Anaerolineae bacterium]|nr:peptidylprolyl isomerase [Anaerolineae bacterium]
MSKKKLVKKKANTEQSSRVIQYVAGGVIALVVILFAWQFIPKQNLPICERFADIPAAAQYDAAPPLMVDAATKYLATVTMENGGEFVIELYPDKAPITVNSFVFLSCKGFFDGVTFHRVLDGFMAQGGDPDGTGGGGPGYQFVNEDSDLTFDKDGVVAMANAGRDTNGSQFFITYGAQEFLNGGYTIFGQVIEGMDVVNALTRRDPEQSPTFEGDKIKSIVIAEG